MGLFSGITDTVGGALFGKGSNSSTGTKPTLTPEQKKLLQDLIGQLSPQLGQPATPYTGELTAPLTGTEQAIQGQVGSAVGGNAGTFDDLTNWLFGVLNASPTDFTDYFNKSVKDPLLQVFNEEILPGVSKRFAASDPYGTDAVKGVTKATSNLTGQLASGLASTALSADESAKNRGIQAAQLLGMLPGQEATSLQGLQELAQVPRGVEQAGLTAKYGEFNRQQDQKQQLLDTVLKALGLNTNETITKNTPAQPGLVQGFLSSDSGSAGIAKLLGLL